MMAAALWFREGGVARATLLHPSLVPPDSREQMALVKTVAGMLDRKEASAAV